MNIQRIDISGNRYGRLVVLEYSYTNKNKQAVWRCKCDCGKEVEVRGGHLREGKIVSCGCVKREMSRKRLTTHGKRHSRLYGIWANMISRCRNPKNARYKDYGGRGIKVCNEWENDFQVFYDWAMENGYADNLTIDRIDVNGNYEPSNCRWADRYTQDNNTRRNRHITFNGETKTVRQWADEMNVSYNWLYKRIFLYGWNIERAFTEPLHENKCRKENVNG